MRGNGILCAVEHGPQSPKAIRYTRNRETAGTRQTERNERLELHPTEVGLGTLIAGVG